MIPQSFIQELLTRVDVVDVVGKAVKLRKAGANYQGLCPFHNEKTPSFSVSPTKQFYHCFGCGAHGSAISFLMEHHGLGFVEAVHELARDVGLTVPEDHSREGAEAARKASQQLALSQWLDQAARYYRSRLKETPAAISYLKERGVTGEIARHFGLGYAPAGWRNLEGVLPDYAAEDAVRAGLVIAGEDGKRYDRFRERIMFPIRNPRGQVIGFGGRVLGQGEPKYLNSPEGPLFSKGHELYGLFEAREGIRTSGRVLVVEGYMDVVMLHQHGCHYAVATLGTATTAMHLGKLLRLADRVVFSFDGDAAGRRAAWRALENALPLLSDTKQLDFLFLPPEHDPDSYIRAYGKAQFEDALLNQSKPLSEYFWEHLSDDLNLNTQEGKAELVKTSSPLLAQITAPALAYLLKQRLSELVGIDPDNLAQLLGQEAPKRHVKQKSYKLPPISVKQPVMLTLVQRQIRSLLINPDWAAYIDLPDYVALDGDFACLANLAETIKSHAAVPATAQVLEYMRGSPYEETVNQIFQSTLYSEEMEGEGEEDRENFQIGMKKLLNELKYKQIETLKQKSLQSGLNENEKKLLLSLLTAKQN